MILCQSQGNDDLIQPVLRENDGQILRSSKNLHAPVFRPPGHIIRKDTPHDISPARIRLDPVYILLRRTAVADQQDMLLVITLPADVTEPFS